MQYLPEQFTTSRKQRTWQASKPKPEAVSLFRHNDLPDRVLLVTTNSLTAGQCPASTSHQNGSCGQVPLLSARPENLTTIPPWKRQKNPSTVACPSLLSGRRQVLLPFTSRIKSPKCQPQLGGFGTWLFLNDWLNGMV